MIAKPLPQPTLPNLSVDDDVDDNMSVHTRGPPPSTYTQDYNYYNSDKNSTMGNYPPPMPAYNPYSTHQAPGSYTHFQQSSASITHEDSPYQQHQLYDDDNDSTAHLSSAAAPFSHQQAPIERSRSAGIPNPYDYPADGGQYDAHDVYQGRTQQPDAYRRRSPQGGGLAYDDASEYSAGSLPGYGVHASPLDNPYSGYSSNLNTPQGLPTHQYQQQQQQPRKGRGYDEEGGGGGYSRAM